MTYKQLTEGERYTIAAYKKQGLSYTHIAKLAGRHKSTISREIARNRCAYDGAYRAFKADQRTRTRRSKSRRNQRITQQQYNQVVHFIKKDWSPAQVVGRMKRYKQPTISHESIYQCIWRDKANGGTLWKHLRQSTKQQRKRYAAYDSRGRLANKRPISERPKSVETRKHTRRAVFVYAQSHNARLRGWQRITTKLKYNNCNHCGSLGLETPRVDSPS